MRWDFSPTCSLTLVPVHMLLNFVHSGVFPTIITPDRSNNFYFGFKWVKFPLRQKSILGIKGWGNIYPLLTSIFVILGVGICIFPH